MHVACGKKAKHVQRCYLFVVIKCRQPGNSIGELLPYFEVRRVALDTWVAATS